MQWKKYELKSRKMASTTVIGQFDEGMTSTGISDLAGNVWEWMATSFGDDDNKVTVKGGSWTNNYKDARPTKGLSYSKSYYSNFLGFRLVLED